eukprot:2733387-Rhodomonas_salina.1
MLACGGAGAAAGAREADHGPRRRAARVHARPVPVRDGAERAEALWILWRVRRDAGWMAAQRQRQRQRRAGAWRGGRGKRARVGRARTVGRAIFVEEGGHQSYAWQEVDWRRRRRREVWGRGRKGGREEGRAGKEREGERGGGCEESGRGCGTLGRRDTRRKGVFKAACVRCAEPSEECGKRTRRLVRVLLVEAMARGSRSVLVVQHASCAALDASTHVQRLSSLPERCNANGHRSSRSEKQLWASRHGARKAGGWRGSGWCNGACDAVGDGNQRSFPHRFRLAVGALDDVVASAWIPVSFSTTLPPT